MNTMKKYCIVLCACLGVGSHAAVFAGPGGGGNITICHHPPGNPDNAHTITIPVNALPAHLAHGDALNECPEPVCADVTSQCCNVRATAGCSDPACEALVCAALPECCIDEPGEEVIEWHQGCTMLASELCGLESPSDCCNNFEGEPGGPGCSDPSCEATVCAVDPFCCETSWDTLCGFEAQELCGDLCCCGTD